MRKPFLGIVAFLTACLPSTASDQNSWELDQLGRIIAAEWDATNGAPTAVSSVVSCVDYWTQCHGDRVVPGREVSAMVRAFSSSRGVPRVDPEEVHGPPHCDWSDTHQATDGPQGLRAEFLEPNVVGDSAKVVVMSTCQAPGRLMAGFGQVHEFIFRRGRDGSWTLAKRQLVFET